MPSPALPVLSISAPCVAAWEEMRGNDRVRFCGQCSRSVFNSTGLSREELLRLIKAVEGRTCMRLLRRTDGTIVTRECGDRPLVYARSREELGPDITWLLWLAGLGVFTCFLLQVNLLDVARAYAEHLFVQPTMGEIDIVESTL